MLQGTWFILVESMPDKYRKSCVFNVSSVWMTTSCHTVCCMLHIHPQQRVRFLVDSNSWNVNGLPYLRTVRQMLKILRQLLEMILHNLAYFLQLGYQISGTKLNQISSINFFIFKSIAK